MCRTVCTPPAQVCTHAQIIAHTWKMIRAVSTLSIPKKLTIQISPLSHTLWGHSPGKLNENSMTSTIHTHQTRSHILSKEPCHIKDIPWPPFRYPIKPRILKDQQVSFQGPGNLIRGAEAHMCISLSDTAMHLCTPMHELCTRTCITKKVMVQMVSKNMNTCKISILLCTLRKVHIHLTGKITEPACTIMNSMHTILLSHVILVILEFITNIKALCYAHQCA